MASLESVGKKAFRIHAKEPASRIGNAVRSSPNSGKPFTLFGEILKEGALLPVRNIGAIMGYTGRSIMKVLGGSLNIGLQAASLLPLPLPGGTANIAELRADMKDIHRAIKSKVEGNPENMTTISAKLKALRKSIDEPSEKSQAS